MENIFRYSIKAIIIPEGKLLVESCDYGRGRFSKLPGGGHQWGETMNRPRSANAGKELNLAVQPLQLVLARDCICQKPPYRS